MRGHLIDDAVTLLEAVAEYEGVNAAADVLGRSPSGVSRGIQRLADRIGAPLLRRRGRRVELTDAGAALVRALPDLREADERVHATITDAVDPDSGQVRIAAHVLAVASVLAPGALRWKQQRPLSSWRIRETEPVDGQRLLLAGETDIVLMPMGRAAPAADDARFTLVTVVSEPVDLVVPHEHWAARRDQPVRLEELSQEKWITGAAEQGSRQEILDACARAGFVPAEEHSVQDWTAVSALVAADLGVSMLPRMSPTHTGIARIAFRGQSSPYRTIVAALLRGAETRGLLAATLETIIAVAADAVRSPSGSVPCPPR